MEPSLSPLLYKIVPEGLQINKDRVVIPNLKNLIIRFLTTNQNKKGLGFNKVSCGPLKACGPWPMVCQRLSADLNRYVSRLHDCG
jgi:hypothetical protein